MSTPPYSKKCAGCMVGLVGERMGKIRVIWCPDQDGDSETRIPELLTFLMLRVDQKGKVEREEKKSCF